MRSRIRITIHAEEETVVMSEAVMPKHADVSVKLGWEAYRKAKTAASWRDISLVDYLSQVVEAAADKDLDRMERERARQRPPEEPDDL
jgi:hypothetical protein